MNKAEYKNEIYNIETIYVYDELISIYKGNLLENNSITVKLSEVKILSLYGVVKSLPEYLIYQKAHELDEKEFEQWMYDNQ